MQEGVIIRGEEVERIITVVSKNFHNRLTYITNHIHKLLNYLQQTKMLIIIKLAYIYIYTTQLRHINQ